MLWGRICPLPFPALLATGITWLMVASLQYLRAASSNVSLPHPHIAFSSRCQISLYLALTRKGTIAVRVHPDNPGQAPYLKIFNLISFAKTLFLDKVTLIGFRDKDLIFLGVYSACCTPMPRLDIRKKICFI